MEQSILIQQAKKPFWVELNYSVCFIMFSGCIILFFIVSGMKVDLCGAGHMYSRPFSANQCIAGKFCTYYCRYACCRNY